MKPLSGRSSLEKMALLSDRQFIDLCKTASSKDIRKALSEGADVNARCGIVNGTALMEAAGSNPDPEVVKVLLANGADIHARDNLGGTALMEATGSNSAPEVVKVLLKGGAEIHAKDKDGMMAFMLAAFNNSNPEVVKVLLEAGADIHARDKKGVTALMFAALNNSNSEVVKVLLESGADICAADKNGHDVFWYARQSQQKEKKQILQSVFLALCQKGTAEQVRKALAYGPDVNAGNKAGKTALMCAAEKNTDPGVVEALLARGADIRAKDKYNMTALMLALRKNTNVDVVNVLKKRGARWHVVCAVGNDAPWQTPQIEKTPEKNDIISGRHICVKDFVVRGNTFKCRYNSHKLYDINCMIGIMDYHSNSIFYEVIRAGYCYDCNVFFIMNSIYEDLKMKGIPICRISDERKYIQGKAFENNMALAQESILYQYGYNVSESENLTGETRRKILSILVDFEILKINDIISYLDFFYQSEKVAA